MVKRSSRTQKKTERTSRTFFPNASELLELNPPPARRLSLPDVILVSVGLMILVIFINSIITMSLVIRGRGSEPPIQNGGNFGVVLHYEDMSERLFLQTYLEREYGLEEAVIIEILDSIYVSSRKYRVPTTLIFALIEVESSFKPNAVSNRDAYGLMQIHYPTWKSKIQKSEICNIPKNIDLGVSILAGYIQNSNGDVEKALYKYLGASNKTYVDRIKALVGGYIFKRSAYAYL